MGTTAQDTITAAAGTVTGPGEPVPVAILARTSTLVLQDPLASLRRQIRACTDWLPAGWVIAGYYWDVESGGIDLEDRSQGDDWRPFADAGIPRDGGMADLLTEAKAPTPRFAAVVCEDIERAVRPGHLQRAETGKGTRCPGHPAVRHRRARLHRGRRRHHPAGPRVKQGLPSGSGSSSRKKPGKASWNTPSTGGTSAPPPTGTWPRRCRTPCRPRPPRAAPAAGSPPTRPAARHHPDL
jgi:hypothetical protein